MNIVMIGAGYVGLVSGACFAELNHNVICVEVNASRLETLLAGNIPIYEPGLGEICRRNITAGRLSFTDNLAETLDFAEAMFICVGTPPSPSTGQADLRYIYAAAEEIGRNATSDMVVVTKSTVPIGTNRRIKERLKAVNPDVRFHVASNPEFLREGAAIKDFLEPDRIVVGISDPEAQPVLEKIYAPMTDQGYPLQITTLETAEMIKYASNSFLAVKIGFINEIADLCEVVGADVAEVAKGMGQDPRIGERFLLAGPGYGGSCFPKDTQALAFTAHVNARPLSLVDTVIASNARRKVAMARKITQAAGGQVAGMTIGVLGVAFKGGTDDMRDSPALDIIPQLIDAGAEVRAYDPAATETARPLLPGVKWVASVQGATAGADIAVILTEWEEFKHIDLTALAQSLTRKHLIDLRNLFEPSKVVEAGLKYTSIGRPEMVPAA